MKSSIVKGLAVLALVLSLANCGKSGGSSKNDNNPNTYYPYNPNYNASDYNYQYQQQYGYRPGGYCQNYQGCPTCYVPCQYAGCGNSGYQQVMYPYAGYYNQNYGYYPQGGSFVIGFSGSF